MSLPESERVILANVRPSPGFGGKYQLACMRCDWTSDPEFLLRCPRCDGALDAELSLENAQLRPADHPEETYLDFLPVSSMDFLVQATSVRTPTRPASALGQAICIPQLWVKDESQQPTGSTKDRLAAIVLAVFREFGIAEWVAVGTGNSSTALARAAHLDGQARAHFFCGREFAADHQITTNDRVSLTVVDGDYARARVVAHEFAERHGMAWEGGFFNWARREGLKIGYLEAFDDMDVGPDVVVQAISSGMGMLAACKGAREYLALGRLGAMPRFLMVQQDTCAPMATAWNLGRAELTDADVIAEPTGLARAILLGDARDSYPYIRDIAMDTSGSITVVNQEELTQARRMLLELEGIDVCYASAATVATARNEAAAGRISPDQVVLLSLTGSMRT
jgi:threonine synthase